MPNRGEEKIEIVTAEFRGNFLEPAELDMVRVSISQPKKETVQVKLSKQQWAFIRQEFMNHLVANNDF